MATADRLTYISATEPAHNATVFSEKLTLDLTNSKMHRRVTVDSPLNFVDISGAPQNWLGVLHSYEPVTVASGGLESHASQYVLRDTPWGEFVRYLSSEKAGIDVKLVLVLVAGADPQARARSSPNIRIVCSGKLDVTQAKRDIEMFRREHPEKGEMARVALNCVSCECG
jgi:hypothetical protein